MGKLGRARTFVVAPKGAKQLRIPTDLTGLTLGRFDAKRKDKNLEAAFGPFCNTVRGQIRIRGIRLRSKGRRAIKSELLTKPAISLGGDLIVVQALYGARDHRFDVTRQLNDAISNGKLHVYIGNNLAGDPCPNTPKDLVVRYRHDGRDLEKTVVEGADLDLP